MSSVSFTPESPPATDVAGCPQATPSFQKECLLTLKLAIPLIVGQLGQMLMGVADTVMIGRLGVAELGAATFANTLLVVPLVLGIGLLTCVSVRVSQARGAADPVRAGEILRHGTVLAILFGLGTVLLTIAILPLLSHMGQAPEVVQRAPAFLMICAVSLVPAFLSMTWKNHADALNRPWPPFWILIGCVLLNITLNWLLIWGHWGFPKLGLEGAAYATLIARCLCAVLTFAWLRRAHGLQQWTRPRWLQPLRLPIFGNLLTIGIPASLQLLTEVSAFAACALLIGTLGATALAAHQVAITCAGVAFMIPLGIAMALTVRVGELVGAQQWQRLRRVLIGGWAFAVGFMSLTMAIFLVAGHSIAEQFVQDQEVIRVATTLLIVAGLFQLVDGLGVVSAFALRGINDVRVPVGIAFVAYWILAVPIGAGLGLGLKWGPMGMWIGLATGLAVAAVALGLRAWRHFAPEAVAKIRLDPSLPPIVGH